MLKKNATILFLLVIAFLCGSLFFPLKTYAVYPVNDAMLIKLVSADAAKQSASWGKDLAIESKSLATTLADWGKTLKDSALKVAMAKFRKVLLDTMVNQIVQWIQGGGKPQFVTDWKSFLKNAADVAGGQALEELLGTDVMSALCSPDWAIRINIGLRTPQTFANTAVCTLSEIGANWNDFMDNFQNGGWKAWIKMSESQNNPYGLYVMTSEEKLNRELKAQSAAANEAQSGAGFLSDKVCKYMVCNSIRTGCTTGPGTYTTKDLAACPSCQCDPNSWQIRSPGKILAEGLSKSVFSDIEWLQNNEQWESYVVAITDALINRLVTEGVMAITSSDTGSAGASSAVDASGLRDEAPPITTLSPADGWHVKITGNEDVFIYYTLDGTQPGLSSTPYTAPIELLATTTIKWFGMDYSGNKEAVNTITLSPPLAVTDTTPTTIAAAVGRNDIALLSNIPATIYYTLDGTDPTTSSTRYMKIIENLEPYTPVKWFGVSTQGSQETPIHALGATPPFPEPLELTKIYDFVKPTAVINASGNPSSSQYLRLDPSASYDNDKTPKIAMYEWDLDNDGTYDWWTADWNRDGNFDESRCREAESSFIPLGVMAVCPAYIIKNIMSGETETFIGNGFVSMQVPAGAKPGVIEVRYSGGSKTIGLRVTDDEGLYASTKKTI